MLAPLVLLLLGFVVWKLWAPAMAWVSAFATLLDRPVRKTGVLPFIAGLETAGGDFQGRPVLLALHHKRGRNSLGYLVDRHAAGTGIDPRARRAGPAARAGGTNGVGPAGSGTRACISRSTTAG